MSPQFDFKPNSNKAMKLRAWNLIDYVFTILQAINLSTIRNKMDYIRLFYAHSMQNRFRLNLEFLDTQIKFRCVINISSVVEFQSFLPKKQHAQRKFWCQLLWTTYDFQLLAKIRVFKVDCLVLTLFLVPNLSSVAQIGWKKHACVFFLLSVQK